MAIYKTTDNKLWDDMDGEALNFPTWPKDAVKISDKEAEDIRKSQALEVIDLTIEEKLSMIGLSKDDLKEFLGLK